MSSSPIAEIIARFGGVRATARAISVHPMTVCHWRLKGRLPAHRVEEIERGAAAAKIAVTREEIVAAVMHGRGQEAA